MAISTARTGEPVDPVEPAHEAVEAADVYELKGEDTAITYQDAGEGGPVLVLDYSVYHQTYTGDEIRRLEGTPGDLLSVEVTYIADGGALDLLLFLPTVNIRNGEDEPIRTVAVLATEATTIGGPDLIDGQIDSYEVIPLTGIAGLSDPA
jgi:hypothetical protein